MEHPKNKIMHDWVVFITVVDMRSFTAAARKLRCGAATVSKSVARLEDILGVELLSRNAHKVEITAAGYITYNRAKEIRQSWQELFSEINNQDARIKGKLRFSAPSILCEYAACSWVFDYINQNPDADVQLLSRDRTELTVASPEFDDLVFKSGMTDSPDLGHQSVGRVRFGLYASPDYLCRHPLISTPEDLNHHWIMKVDHPFLCLPIPFTKGQNTVELTVRNNTWLASNSVSSVLNMTLSGAGVCLALPDWVASQYVNTGELEIILPEWKLPEMPVWLVWRNRENYTRLFHDFRKYIADKWGDLSGVHIPL